MTCTKIVIVGAGAAGLTAAKELQRLGQDFLLLESSHRIGGRAHTEVLAPGMPFDLGAHWIMEPTVNPLMRIAERDQLRLDKDDKHYASGRYFEDGDWLPKGIDRELCEYWDKQFDAMAHASKGHGDISVFDAIDNDGRWANYFHALYAKDATRDVDQASARDALAFTHEEVDLAVADGLGTLMSRYGADVPVTLNSAVLKIDSSGPRVKLDTVKGRIHADKVILTDPMFSQQAGTYGWFSPKRYSKTLASTNSLPMVDVVLITHNHSDHLDEESIKALISKTSHFIVPLAVGKFRMC